MVDDNQEDFFLVRDMLLQAGRGKHVLEWAGTFDEGVDRLRNGAFDAALIDYKLDERTGIELVREAIRQGCNLPCILLTNQGGYNTDVEAMAAGAYDYLDKLAITPALLERSVRYAISRGRHERSHHALIEQNQRQQALMRTIFDASPAGLAVVAQEGDSLVFGLANQAYRALSPHPELDPIGKKLGEIWPEKEGFFGPELIAGALCEQKVVRHEDLRRVFPDGSERFFSLHAQPIEWQGKPGVLIVTWDITTQEQARQAALSSEQHLRESEERYRQLIDVSPDAIFLHSGGRYRYINRAGLRMYGAETPEQILGQSVLDRAHPQFREAVAGRIRILTEERRPVPLIEEKLLRLDGSEITVEALGTPFEFDGEPGALVILHDITERTRTERQLRLSEERFRLASRAVRGIVFDWDMPRQSIYYSEGVQEVLGIPQEEAGANPEWWFERVHPDDLPRLFVILKDLPGDPSRNSYQIDYRMRHQDGHWVDISENSYIIRDEQGSIQRIVGTMVDISRQKAIEQEIRQRERRERARAAELQALMDAVPAIIWIARDSEARVIDGNRLAYQFLRMQPGQNLSKSAPGEAATGHYYSMTDGQLILPPDLPVQRAARGEMIKDYEFDVHFDNGEVRHLLGNATPLFDENGDPAGSVSAFIDTTELTQAERDLLRLERERVQNMAHIEVQRRLIEQREQERLQIARDLHDGPIQELIALSYALENIDGETRELRVNQPVQEAKSLLQQQIAELRSFASALRPPLLVSFGLEKAIRAHLKEFQQKHAEMECSIEAEQSGDLLDNRVRLALFRIYQELMNNVLKHAAASAVKIYFYKTEEDATLEVRDDGRGFSVPSEWVILARQKHLGLVGVQERAEAVGGRVEIQSAPGMGTVVRVVVPLGKMSDE